MPQYVALLDILGFKDIVLNNSHEEVVHLFDNFRIYLQGAVADQKSKVDSRGRTVFDVADSPINSTIISDSIILWTNNESTDDFIELLHCLRRFINFCHEYPFLFLRGGVTYGDLFYDNGGIIRGKDSLMVHPVLVGKGLVDVYEIEKQLQIAGCIITAGAIEAAESYNSQKFSTRWAELQSENVIVPFDIPLKGNKIAHHWTINWVGRGIHPTVKELENGFSSLNRSIASDDVQEKMKNTMDYFNFIKRSVYEESCQ